MRILSIDDSRAVHAFLKDIMSKFILELDHAYNGKEGLTKVMAQTTPYDLILLDWEMPELTGPETLKILKEKSASIPVIMLTSKNELADIQMVLEIGAAEYVMKPFTPEILIDKVETVLGRSLEKNTKAVN